MTYEQFRCLSIRQICAIVDAYDYYLLGEAANGGNERGLDRMGRYWLHHRCLNISDAFEEWLSYIFD